MTYDGQDHRPVILLDGGMGEELRRRSPVADHPLWSAQALVEAPDIVSAVHRDFIDAGADVVTANTYAIVRRRLAAAGIEAQFAELNRRAARLALDARDATGRDVRIAGSLPPLFGSYRPDTVRSFAEIEPLYREQAEVLAPFVDLFICETMSSIDEARAAASAATATGRPVWVAWTLDDHAALLRSGETLEAAVPALGDLPIEAFLANCCAPESITRAMPTLVRMAGGRPAGGYANGFAAIPADWTVESGVDRLGARGDLGPEAYLDHVVAWIDRGARIVGGCCRIGPAHIAAIDAYRRQHPPTRN
jgi:S-methylmethionine-dependent homocysteine/selenocysteine methylase